MCHNPHRTLLFLIVHVSEIYSADFSLLVLMLLSSSLVCQYHGYNAINAFLLRNDWGSSAVPNSSEADSFTL